MTITPHLRRDSNDPTRPQATGTGTHGSTSPLNILLRLPDVSGAAPNTLPQDASFSASTAEATFGGEVGLTSDFLPERPLPQPMPEKPDPSLNQMPAALPSETDSSAAEETIELRPQGANSTTDSWVSHLLRPSITMFSIGGILVGVVLIVLLRQPETSSESSIEARPKSSDLKLVADPEPNKELEPQGQPAPGHPPMVKSTEAVAQAPSPSNEQVQHRPQRPYSPDLKLSKSTLPNNTPRIATNTRPGSPSTQASKTLPTESQNWNETSGAAKFGGGIDPSQPQPRAFH